jgi:hypothetical protein
MKVVGASVFSRGNLMRSLAGSRGVAFAARQLGIALSTHDRAGSASRWGGSRGSDAKASP